MKEHNQRKNKGSFLAPPSGGVRGSKWEKLVKRGPHGDSQSLRAAPPPPPPHHHQLYILLGVR